MNIIWAFIGKCLFSVLIVFMLAFLLVAFVQNGYPKEDGRTVIAAVTAILGALIIFIMALTTFGSGNDH